VSATGRNLEERPRRDGDYYRTPQWCVDAVLSHSDFSELPVWALDPGCGDGAIGAAALAHGIKCIGVEKDAGRSIEAYHNPAYLSVFGEDYLRLEGFTSQVPLVIGNPPYRLAQEFVRKGLDDAEAGGHVLFLLRLNFLAGQKRWKEGLWESLDRVYVLPKRPSFCWGKTDASDYCWMRWTKGSKEPCILTHLSFPNGSEKGR
jgi:predicted RNA methylase